MAPTDRLIQLLNSQVGYHEGRDPDGNWNNHQKYSPAVPSLEWSQDQSWCATFASWAYEQSGTVPGSFPVTASVGEAMNWYKDHGRWSEYPSIGAQVILGGDVHTGIVVGFDADYIDTIEGNTNTNGSAQGDGVYRQRRFRRSTYVTGYGSPTFLPSNPTPPPIAKDDNVNNTDAQVLWSYKNPSEKFDAYAYLLGTWHNVDALLTKVAELEAKIDALTPPKAA